MDDAMMMMMDMQEKKDEDQGEGGYPACCSTKWNAIYIAIFVFLDFAVECMNAYYINDNENWDPIYFQVYVVILVLIFVSVVLVGIWLFPKDSATTRAILPWGFLVFAIANFILFFWVFIYLVLIFPSDEVYVERNRFIKYDHEEGKYKK